MVNTKKLTFFHATTHLIRGYNLNNLNILIIFIFRMMGNTSSLSKKYLLDALEIINYSISIKKEKELRNLFGKVQYILPSRLIACGIVKINAVSK